jgi:DNA-binding FadR family transcriptional regulator
LHRAIAESTQNALLLALFDAVNSVRSLSSWGRLQSAALNKQRWLLYCQQHRLVVQAIASRDPAGAERAMRQHIEIVQKNLLDVAFSSHDQAEEPARTESGSSQRSFAETSTPTRSGGPQ